MGGGPLRYWRLILSVLGVCGLGQGIASESLVQTKRIVIAASVMLDGQGGVLHDSRIVVEDSKIVAIDPKALPVDYDLRGLTVLPGWIDAHVHIAWSFGRDGRNGSPGGAPEEMAYQVASNAWVTLMAGFTTVQSVGSPADAPAGCHTNGAAPRPAPPDSGRGINRKRRADRNAG